MDIIDNEHIPDYAHQLIVVEALVWSTPFANMTLYERKSPGSPWQVFAETTEVTVGKNGLVWGNSLMPVPGEVIELKKEADAKTPAGLFGLCFVFGYSADPLPGLKLPYLPLNENFAGIDDPDSRYYNCIVNTEILKERDWKSSEIMMREDGLYKWGIVIDYNFENQVKGAGSMIFMHIWRGPGQGTEGCVAMPEDKLISLLQWLDDSSNPLLLVC